MFLRYFLVFIVHFLLLVLITSLSEKRIISAIDEENLKQVNSGEWLVILCSKLESDCKYLKRVIQQMPITTDHVGLAFGDPSEDDTLRIRMSAFEPITIYHVIDGEFRKLDSKLDAFSLRDVILLRLWTEIPSLWFWAHPTSKFTNLYIHFYKAVAKLLKSGYAGWGIAGLLTTGLWIINILWCKIPYIWDYFKRGLNQESIAPASLSHSALLSDPHSDFSDA